MILLNDKIVKAEKFGDGSLKCDAPNTLCNWFTFAFDDTKYRFTWCYESDEELFQLWCLVRHIEQSDRGAKKTLTMPYIPHARQDRNVSGRLFTLKYFAEILNQMNFDKIYVLDPHSDVSTALIDRVSTLPDKFNYSEFENKFGDTFQIMYPDNGAAKKYTSLISTEKEPIIGIKHRNREGRIDSYSFSGLDKNTKVVLIRDDICSYGGTFSSASKELKDRGVEKIYLYVSHCELNIIKGDVLKHIDGLYTTDSILDMSVFDKYDFNEVELENAKLLKQKINLIDKFRNVKEVSTTDGN